MTYITTKRVALTIAAITIAPTPALADSASSPVSAKVEIFGGWQDGHPLLTHDDFSGDIAPSLTINAGHGIGIQFDGLIARKNKSTATAAGTHLFLRDSEKGLIGVTASLYRDDAADIYGNANNTAERVGAEAELYLNRFTLAAAGGYEHAAHTPVSPFFLDPITSSKRFYSKESIAFYPDENWKLQAGHSYRYGLHAATLATEFDLTKGHGGTGISIFAEGRFGEQGYNSVRTGVKIYFGGKKSLMERQRSEDPEPALYDDMFIQAPTAPYNNGGSSCCGGCGGRLKCFIGE